MRGACAIVGLGVTPCGVGLGIEGRELRARAVDLALADAGLERDAIDGYIHCFVEREDLRYMGLSPNFSVAVQLEEGPFYHANVTHCANETLRVGLDVEAVFVDHPSGLVMPMFRPRPV